METILQWLGRYSAPVVLLLAMAGAFVFIMKTVTEHEISSQFDRYTRQITLMLEKRSNFEEKVLLDRYAVIGDLETQLGKVETNLRRVRNGAEVKGLIKDGDIVPLTEIFEELFAKKYLIGDRFHDILSNQGQLLIKISNEKNGTKVAYLEQDYLKQQNEFYHAMNDVFGIDKITWEVR